VGAVVTSAPRRRVLLLGGGYVSVHAYRALVRSRRGRRLAITVVSADDCHNFHGFTGEVVAGLLPLGVTRTPLMQALPRARVVHGRVVRIDRTSRVATVETFAGGPVRTIGYDQLIIGSGGREPVDRIPGMAEHGFTLRAPGEFGRWLERLSRLVDPGHFAPGCSDDRPVMIVGGGMAGVEMAAAVADRLRISALPNEVQLCHAGTAVLPGLRQEHPAVALRAERELARLGVHVRTGTVIVAVGDGWVELQDGTRQAVAAVLATTGQRPIILPGLESLPRDSSGAVITDATLMVAPGIWAAGDAARVSHPRNGKPVAANALWAIKAGGALGRNVSRVEAGRRPSAFRYRGLGQAMSFGVGRSATELYGLPISGVPGWLLRLGFFLRFMPQKARALRVLGALVSLPWRGRFTLPRPADRREPAVIGP
jgi:NADH dehydrogenase